jgi:LEA14-like dessication related protein
MFITRAVFIPVRFKRLQFAVYVDAIKIAKGLS